MVTIRTPAPLHLALAPSGPLLLRVRSGHFSTTVRTIEGLLSHCPSLRVPADGAAGLAPRGCPLLLASAPYGATRSSSNASRAASRSGSPLLPLERRARRLCHSIMSSTRR